MYGNEKESAEMASYLYGELEGERRDAFEERLFVEGDVSDRLDETENDLIDAYVSGEMSAAERSAFEDKYLISARRKAKVAAARAMRTQYGVVADSADEDLETEPTGFWTSVAAFFKPRHVAMAGGLATVALVIIGFLIMTRPGSVDTVAINSEVDPVADDQAVTDANENDVQRKSSDEQNVNTIQFPSNGQVPSRRGIQRKEVGDSPRVLVFTLYPSVRSGGRPVLEIPRNAESVNLRAYDDFSGGFETFILELNDESGRTVWNQTVANPRRTARRSLVAVVSVGLFRSGGYELAVSGVRQDGSVEELNFYNFIVQLK